MSSPPTEAAEVPSPSATGSDDIKKRTFNQLPTWPPGSHHYGNTQGQITKPLVEAASELVLDSIGELIVKADGVFTIGDYGTNDGSTSMDLMTKIVGQVRQKHGDELPVQIIYEEQERVDFDSLFANLVDDNSVTSKFANVYSLVTNVNFYKQCVPDNTYDVIFSSFAIDWKENSDVTFKDAIYHESPRASQYERHRFLRAASRDWVKFLLLRAKELKPGGLLIVLSISRLDDYQPLSGNFMWDKNEVSVKNDSPLSKVGSTHATVFSDLELIWHHLKDENLIEIDEYERCTINLVFRSKKEIVAPFLVDESPVVKAGLSIVYHDQVVHTNQLKVLWHKKHREGVDDRDSFAQSLTETVRILTHSSFAACLSRSRSFEQKVAILNEVYDRFRIRVACKHPATYNCDYIVSTLVAKKN